MRAVLPVDTTLVGVAWLAQRRDGPVAREVVTVPARMPDTTLDVASVTRNFLLGFVLPLWVADWMCHRRTDIAHTAGLREPLMHLLMLAEAAVPVLAGLFLEITSPVLALMIASLVLHDVTALWDGSYAVKHREVPPIEQHVHSFLEMVPLMAVAFGCVLH
jgi:hypothetical protein